METDVITNIWNKRQSDLTVKEGYIAAIAPLIIMIGGVVAVGVTVNVKNKIVKRFQKETVIVEVIKPDTE